MQSDQSYTLSWPATLIQPKSALAQFPSRMQKPVCSRGFQMVRTAGHVIGFAASPNMCNLYRHT